MEEASWRLCRTCGKLWPEGTQRRPRKEVLCEGCLPILELLIQYNKVNTDPVALKAAMKNFKNKQIADRRAARGRYRKTEEERQEELRKRQEELRKRRENPKITPKNFFMGQDDWRYD